MAVNKTKLIEIFEHLLSKRTTVIPDIFHWCTYPGTWHCIEYHLELWGQAPLPKVSPRPGTSGHMESWNRHRKGSIHKNAPDIWRHCRLNIAGPENHQLLKGNPRRQKCKFVSHSIATQQNQQWRIISTPLLATAFGTEQAQEQSLNKRYTFMEEMWINTKIFLYDNFF